MPGDPLCEALVEGLSRLGRPVLGQLHVDLHVLGPVSLGEDDGGGAGLAGPGSSQVDRHLDGPVGEDVYMADPEPD